MSVSGNGPDLLFVHGLGSAQVLWNPLVETLSDRYRCWNLDLRGHGASDWSSDELYRMSDYTIDVQAALDHIGSPTIGIGHSLGGIALVRAAAAHEPNLRALYVLDSPLQRPEGEQSASMPLFERQLAMVRAFQAQGRPVSAYQEVLGAAMNPMGDTNSNLMVPEQLTGRAESLSQMDPACMAALIEGRRGEPVSPRVTVPFRLIAADPLLGASFTAEASAPLLELNPQVQIRTLLGVGHQLMMMQGFDETIRADLESWLQGVE